MTEEETAKVEREVEKERKYLQAVRKCTDKEIEKMLLPVRKRAEQRIIHLKLKEKEESKRVERRMEPLAERVTESITMHIHESVNKTEENQQ